MADQQLNSEMEGRESSEGLDLLLRGGGVLPSGLTLDGLKSQLDFLRRELLPKLLVTYGVGLYKPFQLWCMECLHPALPLEFFGVLERYRQGNPDFTFRLQVTDSCPDRIARSRELFRECYPALSLENCLCFRQLSPCQGSLSMRMPQDAIVCYADFESTDGSCREELVQNFCRLLFPGRALMGAQLELALRDEDSFERIGAGIYRRVTGLRRPIARPT